MYGKVGEWAHVTTMKHKENMNPCETIDEEASQHKRQIEYKNEWKSMMLDVADNNNSM